MFPRTTGEIVRRFAAERPDHPALRWPGGELTYRQLDENASRAAQALRAAGIGPGDRVAFLDKNGPEQIEVFFGAAKLGAVPTPVSFRLTAPEVAVVLEDAQARICFVGPEFEQVVEVPGVEVVVLDERYREWRDAAPAQDPNNPQADGDVAFQLYSSGTTGRPKGVELTNANLASSLSIYEEFLGLYDDAVTMVAMPLFHIGGSGWLLAGLGRGCTNVLVRELMPSDLVDLIERERITHAALVPAVIQFMLQVPGIRDRDFSSMRGMLYGASPISETVLVDGLETFGCPFVQCYGLTETTATIAVLPAGDHDDPKRLRSAGIPTPGHEIRVVDPISHEPVAPDEVGEVWVRGPNIMKGYWNMPEATADTIVDGGWLRTGDAGYLDADGYLYLHDRIKDMIVSGAENIYPVEVENVLMAHPAVADAAVIGVPSERWGETPKAIVVRAGDIDEHDLLAWCRERLAGFKCPTSVDWADELPRTPSGKILKRDLRAPYWEGRDRRIG